MKLILCIIALLVSGCGSYGSWLDQVGKRPDPPSVMSDDQAKALGEGIASLRAQSEAIRGQLAAEPDRVRRFDHYRALRSIGDQLRQLEQSLYHAGRPS